MHINSIICILLLASETICQEDGDAEDKSPETTVTKKKSKTSSCYESNKPKGRSVKTDYKAQYFQLFTKPSKSKGRALKKSKNSSLYACWDAKHEFEMGRLNEKLRPNDKFAGFNPRHKSAVSELVGLINGHSSSIEEQVSFLQYLKEHRKDIHPQLLISAIFAVSNSDKTDLYQYTMPSLADMFPSRFLRKGSSKDKKCVHINEKAGVVNGLENRLWYFREDIQLNNQHWIWHLRHPALTTNLPQHRRGELFYYFHHDMLARYGAERISNGFSDHFVEPILVEENLTVATGYQPFLQDGVSSAKWAARPNRTVLRQSKIAEEFREEFPKLPEYWARMQETATTGMVHSYAGDVTLSSDGTNALAETLEAGSYSLNINLYGFFGWHGWSHIMIGSVIVPESKNGAFGVLMDEATAVRDTVFYRIHTGVDDIFRKFKYNLLKPYEWHTGEHPLIFDPVKAKSVVLKTKGLKSNQLKTFWRNRNMDMENGLDFIPAEKPETLLPSLSVCAKHLDHESFEYNIQLENKETINIPSYIRIFMAPRYDTKKVRLNISDQFRLAFTMDAFPTTLKPGSNKIERKSIDSSLTTDWWLSAKALEKQLSPKSSKNANCNCGWPQHLLLPKGTESGMEYDVILMVTDGADFNAPNPNLLCTKAFLHCGYNGGHSYPDKKPMGYPFDRRVHPTLENGFIENFIKRVPNMVSTNVKILHDDEEPDEHK